MFNKEAKTGNKSFENEYIIVSFDSLLHDGLLIMWLILNEIIMGKNELDRFWMTCSQMKMLNSNDKMNMNMIIL